MQMLEPLMVSPVAAVLVSLVAVLVLAILPTLSLAWWVLVGIAAVAVTLPTFFLVSLATVGLEGLVARLYARRK